MDSEIDDGQSAERHPSNNKPKGKPISQIRPAGHKPVEILDDDGVNSQNDSENEEAAEVQTAAAALREANNWQAPPESEGREEEFVEDMDESEDEDVGIKQVASTRFESIAARPSQTSRPKARS